MAGREIKRRVRACPLDVLGGQALPEGEFYRASALIDFSCLVTARKCVPLARDPMPNQSTGGNAMNRRLRSRLSSVVRGEAAGRCCRCHSSMGRYRLSAIIEAGTAVA